MALLWADGFDHYGTSTTGTTNMGLAVWSAVDTYVPATTLPRNSICSLRTASQATTGARRSFGGQKTAVGVTGAFYWTALPASDTTCRPIVLLDQSNAAQITLNVQTSGAMRVYRGTVATGTLLYTTTTQVVYGGTWNHIEVYWVASSTISATDGTIEVWVNETKVIDLTAGSAVDNVNTSNRECSQVSFGLVSESATLPVYIDDVVAYDNSGTYNNVGPIGDKDVLPYYYDSDDAETDWVRNAGANDYEAVDETAQDGDTTYLEAAVAGDMSKLGLAAVPSTVDDVIGVILVNVLRKTQAGASEVTCDFEESTGPTATSNTAHVLTQSYAYYHDVVERNPVDGTTAWNYTTLSAAKLKLTRTV